MNFSLANFTKIFTSVTAFISEVLVPLVFAIALIVFIWGMFQYFIAGGADAEKRSQGRMLALWAIIGFAIMVAVWGLVSLITTTFGFDKASTPCLPTFSGNCKNTGGGGGTFGPTP